MNKQHRFIIRYLAFIALTSSSRVNIINKTAFVLPPAIRTIVELIDNPDTTTSTYSTNYSNATTKSTSSSGVDSAMYTSTTTTIPYS